MAGRTKPPSLSLHNDKIILRHLVAVALSEFFRAYPERFGRQASPARGVESFVIDLLAPGGCASVLQYWRRTRRRSSRSSQRYFQLALLTVSGSGRVMA